MRIGLSIARGLTLAGLAGLLGCVGNYEHSVRRELAQTRRSLTGSAGASAVRPPQASKAVAEESSLADYLRVALGQNPGIRAGFERWRASVHRISEARRLPDPLVGFDYFVRPVETRLGPQRTRISLQQAFPWPTKLTAGTHAASAHALALQRRFEAQVLAVAAQVRIAYWNLWQLRANRSTHSEHLEVIRGLSEAVGARLSVGTAALSDLQQINLRVARIEDRLRGMDEAERGLEARLRAAIGSAPHLPVATPQAPGRLLLPVDSAEVLTALAQAHPSIDSLTFSAYAAQATAHSESARGLPSFALRASWVATGTRSEPALGGNGRDAVIVGAAVQVPLWRGSYADAAAAAEADSRALLAERQTMADRAGAELTATLAQLRDAKRRAELYRMSLVPQAETAYQSVLGAYAVGRGTIAQALLSQRDLLELRIELQQARADHARMWARLQELVGQEVRARIPSSHPDADGRDETD